MIHAPEASATTPEARPVDLVGMTRQILTRSNTPALDVATMKKDDQKIVAHVLRYLSSHASPRLTLALIYEVNGCALAARSFEWFVRQVPIYAERALERPALAAHVATMFLADEPTDLRPTFCPFCAQRVADDADLYAFDGTQGHFACTMKLVVAELQHQLASVAGRVPA